MNESMEANRGRWNELAPIHAASAFYDVEAFKAGQNRLHWIEREEVGDVAGKTMLHLQCHFGLDTLSWARLGAHPTGVDYAEAAIAIARSLAAELGLAATFVHAEIDGLPEALTGEFDIVFTSWGVLGWLPDLTRWGRVIAHFLKPGGTFYIAEGHPTAGIFDDAEGVTDLRVAYPYASADPIGTESDGSYAAPSAAITHRRAYWWAHGIGEVVDALIGAGLRIDFLHEFPVATWRMFPFMIEDGRGMWRLPPEQPWIPLSFSIKATKPA